MNTKNSCQLFAALASTKITTGLKRLHRLRIWQAISCAIISLTIGLGNVWAESPAGCNANNVFLNISVQSPLNGIVTNGQTAVFAVSVGNPNNTAGGVFVSCDATGMNINYECPGANGQPSGVPTVLATNVSLLAPPPGPNNETNFFNLPCVINVGANGLAVFRSTVTNGFLQSVAPAPFSRQSTINLTVVHPQICIGKQCVSTTNTGSQVVITYSGSVTNCGDETLINVQVFNNQPASNTLVLGPITLAPGAVTNFTRSYTNSVNVCGPFSDTLTVIGTGIGSGAPVTASASATCTIAYTPCIAVTKNCDTVAIGSSNTVSGVVTNCGNITLTNITIVDNVYGSLATVASLAPHTSQAYSKLVLNSTCGNFPNTVTAIGTSICGGSVTNTATNTCVVTESPCIQVTKNCDTVVVGSPNTVSGVVTNCGNITLTNITIVDNLYGSLTTVASLAPHTSQAYSRLVTNSCGNFPNIVTATGRSTCGTLVSATATNTCVVTENPCIQVTKTCDTVIVGQTNLVTAVVTNCGNVPLHGITVVDNIYGSVGTIALLAPGATATLTKSVVNTCGNFPNTVTAIGLSPCNTSVTNTSTATCVVTENPCIQVTKTCDSVVVGQANLVTAVVTNCGNVPLHGITVVDNIYGSVGTIALLAPGATATLTKSVTNVCGSFPNTVTAIGLSPCNTSVTNTSTATCVVTENPCIQVTKTCNTVNNGQPNLVTAVVTNCGNVPLHGITVVDNLYGSVGTIALLAPGGTATLTKSVTNTCGNFPNTVTAIGLSPCNTPVTNTATATCSVLCMPVLKVYKQVVCFAPGGCEPFSPNLDSQKTAIGVRTDPANNADCPAFCYRITVTNAGNVTISNLVVLDSNTSDGKVLDLSNCGFPTNLAPGASVSCIVTTNHCVNATNVVTASGVGSISSGGTTNVGATDTNRVTVVPISVACNVQVLLTNGVAAPEPPTCLVPGTPYIVRSIIINDGQFALQNVKITSTGSDQLCNLPLTITNLAINERRTNDCTFVCDVNSSHTYAVLVTGEASQTTTNGHVCDHNIFGQPIVATNQNPCSDSVCCQGTPKICIGKEVACVLSPTQCGTYGPTAIAIMGDEYDMDAAFCYRISITNCGQTVLTNVTVNDSHFGNLTTNFFNGASSGTLAIGEVRTYEYRASIPLGSVTNMQITVTNTATGTGWFAGISTNDQDSASVEVKRGAIACKKLVFSPDDTDGNANNSVVILPGDGNAHPVVWSVIVYNTGLVNLTNVTIADPGCLAQPLVIPSLNVGQSATNVLCSNNVVCTAITNTVTVEATVDAGVGPGTNVCSTDIEGNPLNQVVRSDCSATVICTHGGCRETGGGRQPGTLTYTSPAVLDIVGGTPRYTTHGGQIGAPVGNETAFDPNSDCIHGRQTYVRHIKGGLVGNFQARSFDSLMCACLGGVDCTNSIPVAGELCNPGNPDGCGPEPRKASANKIAFSGQGDYVLTQGRRSSRNVLFRIDIEDRSEPGGSHPGGQKPPPDRYRIRIWVVNSQDTAQYGSSLCGFRQAIAASKANVVIKDGAPGALGSAVFGVRAPDIDDGGELERGNHQLHPMIKECNKPTHTCP